jgi:hypothetical protein
LGGWYPRSYYGGYYGDYYYPSYGYGYGYSYPSYGYYGYSYPTYGDSYSVARPVSPNPPASVGVAKIFSPRDSGVTLSYSLNDSTFTIPPGASQTVNLDRLWVISFDRGGQFGRAEYSLQPGLYTFAPTDRGWELFRTRLQNVPAQGGAAMTPTPAQEY